MANEGIPIKTAMNLFLRMRLNDPKVWNFEKGAPVPRNIQLDNGQFVDNGNDLLDLAVTAKRQGNYNQSTYYYTFLLSEEYKQFGKISITSARSYCKTLICENDFAGAFSLLSTMFADMQQAVMGGLRNYDEMTYMLIQSDYQSIFNMAIEVVDNNDYSNVEPFCANYAGSPLYRLAKSRSEIKASLQEVRDQIRMVYGK